MTPKRKALAVKPQPEIQAEPRAPKKPAASLNIPWPASEAMSKLSLSERVQVKIAKALMRLMPIYQRTIEEGPVEGPDPLPVIRRGLIEYEDEVNGGFFRWIGRSAHLLSGKDVLDLGSGYGGRAVRYSELGARSVIGIDIKFQAVRKAVELSRFKQSNNSRFVQSAGEHMPFADESFDIITAYDVFEHVEDPEKCLQECKRVLRKGGQLLLVFPPYFHPLGTHLEGYVSNFPYLNLLFSTRVLVSAADEILKERNEKLSFVLRPKDKLYGMNGLTIRAFKQMVLRTGFAPERFECRPLFEPYNRKYKRFKMKYYYWFIKLLPELPVLNELFTGRVVCCLVKPDNGHKITSHLASR